MNKSPVPSFNRTLSASRSDFLIRSESAVRIKKNRLPSNDDYSKILKKLDLVITNANYGQRLILLTPKNNLNFYLDKGTIQYIHINPRGKFSPLQVKIFRNYGKIKTFVSKKIAEPCEEIHDEEFNRDMFEINDLSGVFRIDRIALGIKALTDSNFVISIKYKSTETKSKFGETDRKQLFFYSKKNLVEEDTLDEKIKEAKIKSE